MRKRRGQFQLALLFLIGCGAIHVYYSLSHSGGYHDSTSSMEMRERDGAKHQLESGAANKNHIVPAGRKTKRPKLRSLIKGETVIGDPQFLLDFAILGVAKCGTTTMRDWLCEHPEAQCPFKEVNDLSRGRPAWLVERLYELPKGDYKRGYKSPKEFAFDDTSSQMNAMKYLTQYWPQTQVLIGLRHPGTSGIKYVHSVFLYANILISLQ